MESWRRLGCVVTVIFGTALIALPGCADVIGADFDDATLDELEGAADSLEEGCQKGERSCDGACLSFNDPKAGCGAGCGACLVPNASELGCKRGTCIAVSCKPGFADCDGNPATGCEASLTDVRSCGACGVRCAVDETCGANGCVKTAPLPPPPGPPGCTPITFYVDSDGDGVGTSQSIRACVAPPGTSLKTGDCADDRADVFPGQLQRFGTKYKTTVAGGLVQKGFDYDCSGVEERDPAAEVLPSNPAPYGVCAKNGSVTRGVAPSTRTGVGIDPYCGQTDRYQCAMTNGTCFCTLVGAIPPVACR